MQLVLHRLERVLRELELVFDVTRENNEASVSVNKKSRSSQKNPKSLFVKQSKKVGTKNARKIKKT